MYGSIRVSEVEVDKQARTAVVVGGGWAGFGAAHALTKLGFSVTVLDASPSPGGLSTGFRTAQGRPVEAGIKGFWWQYHNIYSLLKEVNVVWPFTDWTMSSFYSPEGIQVEAPVFNELPRLPTPLGSFLYTSPYFRNLSVVDRLTALPLIQALLEFDADEETYAKYDAMTARELFRKAGVSAKLYRDFLQPILLVTLFAPGEQLSAAAALGALYYYVLAHQADFDVCWCKGSVAEAIFKPWLDTLNSQGCRMLGNNRVVDVIYEEESNKITGIIAMDGSGERTVYEADVVVFAVGVQAMQRIVASSPALAGREEFAGISNLGTVDVLATRLWLDRRVPLKNPSNVLAGFEPTTGATLFNLNALQGEFADEPGSVLELDFYHANQLLPLSDDAVIQKVMKDYLTRCEPRFAGAQVVDSSVLRFKNAVTLFGPGSHQHMPSTTTSFQNVFMSGDWLRQGPGAHGARGLSQEKAFVTGLIAANAAAASVGLQAQVEILAVDEDEAHIAAGKAAVQGARRAALALGLTSPFL
uniref:Amine oxidase domain-containing protein n=1 Tax=Physcomitrium patens TaxID=3218 RepID=A0A7I4C4P7_PHYPA